MNYGSYCKKCGAYLSSGGPCGCGSYPLTIAKEYKMNKHDDDVAIIFPDKVEVPDDGEEKVRIARCMGCGFLVLKAHLNSEGKCRICVNSSLDVLHKSQNAPGDNP